jgi:hypothetical protein
LGVGIRQFSLERLACDYVRSVSASLPAHACVARSRFWKSHWNTL